MRLPHSQDGCTHPWYKLMRFVCINCFFHEERNALPFKQDMVPSSNMFTQMMSPIRADIK
jgi:hypothetical protein